MVKMEHKECGQGAVKLPSEDEPTCNFGSIQSATSADSESKEKIGKVAESVLEADADQQDASSEHNEAKHVKVIGDSQLVIKQVIGEYRCENRNLQNYLSRVIDLLCQFGEVEFKYVPREGNKKVNDLVQSASGYKEPTRGQVEIHLLPSVFMREPIKVMGEVHEGLCGTHLAGKKMR